jgi:hypothetical protein
MAEPERDDRGVDTGFEEAHRGGVAQGVDGDVLTGEPWMRCGGACRV